ncbi:hypothetical protein ACLOJK_040424 [Asimina triloba]
MVEAAPGVLKAKSLEEGVAPQRYALTMVEGSAKAKVEEEERVNECVYSSEPLINTFVAVEVGEVVEALEVVSLRFVLPKFKRDELKVVALPADAVNATMPKSAAETKKQLVKKSTVERPRRQAAERLRQLGRI